MCAPGPSEGAPARTPLPEGKPQPLGRSLLNKYKKGRASKSRSSQPVQSDRSGLSAEEEQSKCTEGDHHFQKRIRTLQGERERDSDLESVAIMAGKKSAKALSKEEGMTSKLIHGSGDTKLTFSFHRSGTNG